MGDVNHSAKGVSVCIPSSVIKDANACNPCHAAYIAHQIARVAAEFKVQELIVLDIPDAIETVNYDSNTNMTSTRKKVFDQEDDQPDISPIGKRSMHLALLLQYFVTPPYLLRSIFKSKAHRRQLRHATKLPKLNSLPFSDDKHTGSIYKEGITIPKKSPRKSKLGGKKSLKLAVTKYVNIGKDNPLELAAQEVPINVRVTVDIKQRKIVSPEDAYNFTGSKGSFGYYVRCAKNLSAIFVELSVEGGYTETIFINADNYFNNASPVEKKECGSKYKGTRLLLIGNIGDYERSLKNDPNIRSVHDIIDSTLRVPPRLRIEDALLMSLTQLNN